MKERKLKVTYAPGSEYKEQIPRIVLQGKWLKELGFEGGEHVTINYSNENIVVSKNKDLIQSTN